MPNAGKSTLISSVSNARPKIADYPFTTKVPNLGLVRIGVDRSFVIADIPGLIKGAHNGAGMGIKFLKHVERTHLFLHLVDANVSANDALHNYSVIRNEIISYDSSLAERPEIVVLTKMDIPSAAAVDDEIRDGLKKIGVDKIVSISAVTRSGIEELVYAIGAVLFE